MKEEKERKKMTNKKRYKSGRKAYRIYKIKHLLLFSFLDLFFGLVFSPSRCARIILTTWQKERSTLTQVLAEVSIKSHPRRLAIAYPSSRVTSRSVTLSHLLPTNIIGTLSTSLTRKIWSLKRSMRSKVERDVMEYTSKNPSPSLIHWSLNAVYSSTGI